MGQSAGSASVSHHVNSPYASGLFHRVIEVSGSSGAWFASTAWSAESARKMAPFLLCPTHSDTAMMDCYRNRDATVLGKKYPSSTALAIESSQPLGAPEGLS